MNNSGQVLTPITLIFMVIAFIIVWVLFAGKFLNDSVGMAMDTGYFTGVSAFLMSNMNLIVFIVLLASIIAVGFFTTRGT